MTAPAMAQPSEDSDGLHQTLSNSLPVPRALGSADAPVDAVDPAVKEHGALFVVGVNAIHGNQMAIAAKFARDQQIRFDPKTGEFTGYSATTGAWEALREPEVKRLLEAVS